MESFYTIQGEGKHSGTAAYFIRFGGCDVGCVWCDVKESWPMDGHTLKSTHQLVEEVLSHQANLVVITGGEPLMYDLSDLTKQLKSNHIKTHLETSGAYPLTGKWDWVCLSPKKFKKPVLSILEKADELKIIIFNKSDFIWAEEYAAQMKDTCRLYLQPEFSKEKEILPSIIEYVKQNPKWRISLQIHKIMSIP